IGGPEPRRIWRERLVPQHEAAGFVETELELRVGEDDPAVARMLGHELVERERRRLHLVEALHADELDGRFAVAVLVVPRLRLRRRCEDRPWQLLRLDETLRQPVP